MYPNQLNKLKRAQKSHPLKSQAHDLILLMPQAWYLHSGVGTYSDSLLRISTPQFNGSPFNKNSSLKVLKFHAPNGKVHSSLTDPTQATVRMIIVLESRIQESGTEDNNLVN